MTFTPTGVEFVARGLSGYLGDLRKADKAQQGLGTSAGSAGRGFLSLGSAISNVGAIAATAAVGGVAALGAAITGFAVSGVQKAVSLEQQMSNIAAVMGETANSVQPLKDLILDLAVDPNLKVSATEAAQAVELLARNGLEMSQIMDGAAKSTVALANATGAEFGLAADIATDVMSLFNIEASDMERAIDGITGVTTSSKFSIDDFRFALAQSGGVAAGLGVEFEDLTTALSATASAFASGGDAGTSFRTFLQRLVNPTKDMQQIMDDYNISLFDSEGNMKELADVADELNRAFDGLTEAQKAQIATQLGGADASRTVLELAKFTREEFLALRGEVNQSGQAFQAAAARVDSLQGAMEIFRSVIEAIQIQVGDKFLPILRRITVGFTELASRIGPRVTSFFGGIANAIENLIDIGNEFVRGFVSNFGNDFGALGQIIFGVEEVLDNFLPEDILQRVFDFNTALLMLARTIINDVTAGFNSFSTIVDTAITQAIEFLADVVLPKLTQALTFVNENWETFKAVLLAIGAILGGAVIASAIVAIGSALVALINPITVIIGLVALLTVAWQQNWLGIRDITAQVGEVILAVFEAIRAVVIGQVLPSLRTALGNLTEAMNRLGIDWEDVLNALLTATVIVFGAIATAIVTVIAVITSIVAAVAQGVATMTSWLETLWANVATIFDGIVTSITGAKNIITGILEGDLPKVMDGLVMVWEGNVKVITGLFWLIVDTISGTLDTAKDIVGTFIGSIIGFFTVLKDTLVGNSIIPDMVESIIGWFESLSGPITSVLGGIADTVSGIFSGLTGGGVNFDVGAIGTNIITARMEAKEFNETLEETIDILKELKRELDTTFDRAVNQFRKKVLPAIEKVEETFNEFVKDVVKFQSETLPELTKSFQEFGDDVSQVFQDMRSDLNDLLNDIVQFGIDSEAVFNEIEQAMQSAAAAVKQIANDLAAAASALASLASQADNARDKLNQLNSVSMSAIRNQLQSLSSQINSTSNSANSLAGQMQSIANTNLGPLRGAVQGLGSDLNAIQSSANLAKQGLDALAQADLGNFATLSSQISNALPFFEDLAVASGLAASNIFGISNSRGALEGILDLLREIEQAAKDAAKAINAIPPPSSTSLSLTQTTNLLPAPNIKPSSTTVSVPIGPVFINSEMDMAVFEQRVERVITNVTQ